MGGPPRRPDARRTHDQADHDHVQGARHHDGGQAHRRSGRPYGPVRGVDTDATRRHIRRRPWHLHDFAAVPEPHRRPLPRQEHDHAGGGVGRPVRDRRDRLPQRTTVEQRGPNFLPAANQGGAGADGCVPPGRAEAVQRELQRATRRNQATGTNPARTGARRFPSVPEQGQDR